MVRPVTIETQEVIETARRLFLEHGFACSTSRIARELGISEGSIFRRFATKEELFSRAMGLPTTDFAAAWIARAGEGGFDDQLEAIAHELVAYLRVAMPRMIMLRQSSLVDPVSMVATAVKAPPVVFLDALSAYFAREGELRRFEASDPRIAARMLFGALANFVFFEVLGFEAHDSEATKRTIRGMVQLMVKGSQPS